MDVRKWVCLMYSKLKLYHSANCIGALLNTTSSFYLWYPIFSNTDISHLNSIEWGLALHKLWHCWKVCHRSRFYFYKVSSNSDLWHLDSGATTSPAFHNSSWVKLSRCYLWLASSWSTRIMTVEVQYWNITFLRTPSHLLPDSFHTFYPNLGNFSSHSQSFWTPNSWFWHRRDSSAPAFERFLSFRSSLQHNDKRMTENRTSRECQIVAFILRIVSFRGLLVNVLLENIHLLLCKGNNPCTVALRFDCFTVLQCRQSIWIQTTQTEGQP